MTESAARTSVTLKIVPILIALSILAVGLTAWLVPKLIIHNVTQDAITSAEETVQKFKALRGYYTKFVVKKALSSGMKPSFSHANQDNSIPLPATLIHDLSALFEEQGGTKLKLYSPFPFPNRASRHLDQFGRTAWGELEADPTKTYFEIDESGSSTLIRVGVADTMVSDVCVNCHNSRADTPKDDWELGDLRGVLEVSANIDSQLAQAQTTGWIVAGTLTAALLIIIGVTYIRLRSSVLKPVVVMSETMGEIAGGAHETDVPYRDRSDEVGVIAGAVQFFKERLLEIDALRRNQADEEAEALAKRKEERQRLSQSFQQEVGDFFGNVTDSSRSISQSSNDVRDNTTATRRDAEAAATAAGQAAENVELVAAASQQLAASVEEISNHVEKSSGIARQAVNDAAKTDTEIRGLAEAAQRIGQVVSLISDIAEQTNLLALNATIEAARAGDAGKGFAVVANEVKSLANQTGKATEEITSQVHDIQSATERAVEAIQEIRKTTEEVNEIASHIANSIGEQGEATNEIAKNIQSAASGADSAQHSADSVADVARKSEGIAEDMASAALNLSQQMEQMQKRLQDFLDNINKV